MGSAASGASRTAPLASTAKTSALAAVPAGVVRRLIRVGCDASDQASVARKASCARGVAA